TFMRPGHKPKYVLCDEFVTSLEFCRFYAAGGGDQLVEGPQNSYRIATRLFSCRTFTKSAGYCRFVNANQPFHGTTGRPFRAGLQKRHVGDGLGSDFSGDADLPRANLLTALSEARHCHHPRFSGGTL